MISLSGPIDSIHPLPHPSVFPSRPWIRRRLQVASSFLINLWTILSYISLVCPAGMSTDCEESCWATLRGGEQKGYGSSVASICSLYMSGNVSKVVPYMLDGKISDSDEREWSHERFSICQYSRDVICDNSHLFMTHYLLFYISTEGTFLQDFLVILKLSLQNY